MPPTSRTMTVAWHDVRTPCSRRIMRVVLTDGYTTVEDIPKIISVAVWTSNRQADRVIVDSVVETDVTP